MGCRTGRKCYATDDRPEVASTLAEKLAPGVIVPEGLKEGSLARSAWICRDTKIRPVGNGTT